MATRKLTVTSCDVLKTGANATTGRPWTIYEVFAVDEAGAPVEAKLRAFDPLPLNELVPYTIEMRQDPRHGTSYTLIPPREHRAQKKDTGFKTQIQELQARAGKAESRVAVLEATVRLALDELNAVRAVLELEPISLPENLGLESGSSGPDLSHELGAGGNALSGTDIPF